MTAADPGRFLLDKIDAREQALTREAARHRPGSTSSPPGSANSKRRSATCRSPQDPHLPRRARRRPARRRASRATSRGTRSPRLPADPDRLRGPPPSPRARDLCLALTCGRGQEHREHPLQAQAPGQPRHPRRDEPGLFAQHVHSPAAAPARSNQPARKGINRETSLSGPLREGSERQAPSARSLVTRRTSSTASLIIAELANHGGAARGLPGRCHDAVCPAGVGRASMASRRSMAIE